MAKGASKTLGPTPKVMKVNSEREGTAVPRVSAVIGMKVLVKVEGKT